MVDTYIFSIAPKGGGKNYTLVKPLEDSSLTFEESEDILFQMSNLEQHIKGSMKQIDLANLQGEFERRMDNMGKNMENIKKNMEKSMEKLVSLI